MPRSGQKYLFLLVIGVCCLVSLLQVHGQDFGFPEETGLPKDKQNANNRKPLFIPDRCGVNEYLYPGDQKDDWVCDCRPGFLYYPDTNTCYQIFTRGPCKANEFLILARGRAIPVCYPNPCLRDNFVQFQNRCYELNQPGPCRLPELGNVVGVNVTTLLVQCQKKEVVLDNRFNNEDEMQVQGEIPYCAKGSKRNINGLCSQPTKEN